MLKKLAFSIRRDEWKLFGFMFALVCLVNVNFSILRSMRNALVVADTGGSAAFIPYFELFGTFPASIILTWALSRLMRAFSFRFIFSATMLFFLLFFLVFAFWVYPHRESIQGVLETKLGFLFGLTRFKVIFTHWPDMIFYIMSELWKVALLSVLFWGFVNQHLSMDEAKRFYPPLMLGSSVGTILSGPLTVFCTSQLSWNLFPLSHHRWQHSLYLLTLSLLICGLLSLFAFDSLFKKLKGSSPIPQRRDERGKQKEPFSRKLLSLSSSVRYLMKSPYLTALLFIVVAEYIAYALGELIFLQTLKDAYPSPADYCQYLGNLSLWTGVLTALFALVLTPYLLQTYGWGRSALITPVLMVIVTFAFFAVICFGNAGFFPGSSFLSLAVLLGSLHFVLGRATKYTIFDSTKELAFIPLDQEGQVKGKLIIDGIGSRLGRGASSMLSIFLFLLLGGPAESSLFAGILAVVFALASLPTARFLGNEFEKKSGSLVDPKPLIE
ncbi:MAG: Npt1/Npt2 family nucleotide transporter [Chlamydiales bacterium]